MGAVRQAILPTHPMIFSLSRRIQSFTGGTVSLAKGNANEMAYLVGQGQKEVIEEDGGDRNRIILIVIPHCQSQQRLKLTPTFSAVLRVLKVG